MAKSDVKVDDITIHAVFDMDNIHTHDMEEKLNHLDLEIQYPMPPKVGARILNYLVKKIINGENYENVKIIEADQLIQGFPIKLRKMVSALEPHRKVIRLISPDRNGYFPDDPKCSDLMTLKQIKS